MSKTHQANRSGRKMKFEYKGEAKNVFLAGTFNDWDPQANPLSRESAGPWRTELTLAPGRHEYKFVVDGEWRCEPGSEEDVNPSHFVTNAFGTINRVIEV